MDAVGDISMASILTLFSGVVNAVSAFLLVFPQLPLFFRCDTGKGVTLAD